MISLPLTCILRHICLYQGGSGVGLYLHLTFLKPYGSCGVFYLVMLVSTSQFTFYAKKIGKNMYHNSHK